MALAAWQEVAVPHRDIREGGFDESTFAADLADVLADRGPLEYRDAATFFRKTYPTEGMVKVLAAVLRRLAGQKGGEPVIQIQTPFGGGKTHSLIALYHLFNSPDEAGESELGRRTLQHAGAERMPQVRIAAFVGTAADPLSGLTPWGQIATQLGSYQLLEEHDRRRQSPGRERLHELFRAAGTPVLILMDEIALYAAKCVDPRAIRDSGGSLEEGRAYQTQVLAFFQEFTEAVKGADAVALVMTLPSSAPYGEEGERALVELQRIAGRMEAIYQPVQGLEIYDVIRTRLFETVGDERSVKRVAGEYFEMYQRLGSEVPAEVRQPSYREKIRRAYPFHPELIDVLFERWGTFATFQRTRGVLRLLAEVVADLYERNLRTPMIHSAHVELSNQAVRSELVKHIGNEFESVIGADIASANAKAQRLDQTMGSEYARFRVGSGLATAIFMYSFSAGQRNGITLPQLRVAVLREGVPPALVGDALKHLEEELWYLHVEKGLYRFSGQPNLNRVIVEREELVEQSQIEQELRERLERLAGRELKVFPQPRAPEDVPDTKELKLAVVTESSEQLAQELLERSGTTFRTHKNTLVVLCPMPGSLGELNRLARRYLALESTQNDTRLVASLSQENRGTLAAKLKDASEALDRAVLNTYRRLYKLGRGALELHDLGLPTVGQRITLAQRVWDYLRAKDILLTKIAPRYVLAALSEGQQEKGLEEVYEAFLNYPHLPMLADRSVLESAVLAGVKEGEFAVRAGDQYYIKDQVPETLPAGAALVRKEAVPEPAGAEKGAGTQKVGPTGDSDEQTGGEIEGEGGGGTGVVGAKLTKAYSLRASLPWQRLSDFIRGVLSPLSNAGADIELTVEVKASSKSGIPEETIKKTVHETLEQLGAKIEEERPNS